MLSNAYAQDQTAETLLLSGAELMARQLRAEIRPHTRIMAIDPAARRIRFAAGELLGFTLAGTATADKQSLGKQLPPTLP